MSDAHDHSLAPAATRGASTLDFSRYRARQVRTRLLGLLDQLVAAIEHRDIAAVWRVLDEPDACRSFPSAVREEALLVAGMPVTSLRAPIRLYRYYLMLQQLGDEPGEMSGDPDQLRMALEHEHEHEQEETPDDALPLHGRTDDGPRAGGPSRRRSGSR